MPTAAPTDFICGIICIPSVEFLDVYGLPVLSLLLQIFSYTFQVCFLLSEARRGFKSAVFLIKKVYWFTGVEMVPKSLVG